MEAADSKAGEVMHALVARRLLKRVRSYDFPKLQEMFAQPDAGYIAEPSKQVLRDKLPEAEAIVADALGVEPHWVSLYWMHIANPISNRFSFTIEGKKILIQDGERRHEFNDVSEVFSPNELPAQMRIELYARMPGDQSPTDLNHDMDNRIDEGMKKALTVVGRSSAEVGGD